MIFGVLAIVSGSKSSSESETYFTSSGFWNFWRYVLYKLVIPLRPQGNSTTFRTSQLILDDLLVTPELVSVGVVLETADGVCEPSLEEAEGASRGY
jgi:hypothetical protein